jgi:MFS family permease
MNSHVKLTTATRPGVLVIALASFLVPFMGSALNLALPDIGARLDMSAGSLAWIATAYLISTAILQLPLAALADRIGHRRAFRHGLLLFSVATGACALSPNTAVLLVLRALSGAGAAMVFATGTAILTALVPAARRGRALGINVAVVYAALAAGPLLGGLLTHHLGWQSIFLVTGAAGLLAHHLARLLPPDRPSPVPAPALDRAGILLYSTGLAAAILGFTRLARPTGTPLLLAGLVLLFLFARHERRHASPLLDTRLLLHNRPLRRSLLAALVNYSATSAITFLLSLHLQYTRGLDPRHAGIILVTQALLQSFTTLFAGRLSDRHAPARLATLGMSITVIGLFFLALVSPSTPTAYLLPLLALLGIGFGTFSSPNTNLIMSAVTPPFYGQASALAGTARLLGQTLSMTIATMSITLYLGDASLSPALSPSLSRAARVTYIISLFLCLLGLHATRPRARETPPPPR